MSKPVTVGMIGAGRGCELHMNGLSRGCGVPVRLKTVVARRPEQLESAVARWGFERVSTSFEDVLADPEIDIVDICTPPYVHADMAIRALRAGKHVICEKPLSGYFGQPGDETPVGDKVPKRVMYERLLRDLDDIRAAAAASGAKFMYAENFVYAPAVVKAAEIVRAKGSRILYAHGEESLKGSSSPVAGDWCKTGGGTLMRTGSHPLAGILWLKMQEAQARGEHFGVQSVVADMARVTPSLTEYEHRHIAARPCDVEDTATVVVSFADGTRANIVACDTLLGGSKNRIELYCNDAAMNLTLTMSDAMETYLLDEDGMGDVGLSEMLPAKTGWNKPFLSDELMRGYVDEMADFMGCVYYDREPKSGLELAILTTQVIYAAYVAAEEGTRFCL